MRPRVQMLHYEDVRTKSSDNFERGNGGRGRVCWVAELGFKVTGKVNQGTLLNSIM